MRLQIKPNAFVTIMGPNGSGKTTLSKLIPGLYAPTKGRVLIDGADVSQFTRRELASWIGYVPQETFLFSGTLRENIAKALPDATDEQVLQASKAVGLHDYLIDLPDGYATDIGEAGHLLPGGIRQRVAIARALVADPPVLILDEPTSNLDREGEQELCETFRRLSADHTLIVITHSQTMLAACHQILVMQKGRIVRAGKPEEVLLELMAGKRKRPPAQRKQAGRSRHVKSDPERAAARLSHRHRADGGHPLVRVYGIGGGGVGSGHRCSGGRYHDYPAP